jgi:hypothetical protein
MHIKEKDHCKLPWRVRKYKGTVRICECGKLWTPTYYHGYPEGGFWTWSEVTIETGGIGAVIKIKE